MGRALDWQGLIEGHEERLVGPELAQALAARRQEIVSRLERLAEERGLVVFDGEWLTTVQAQRRFWQRWWRDWLRLVEYAFLFAIILAAAGLCALVLASQCGVLDRS
ncbi:MAG: hypothetical protein AB1486_08600 [Planctomycetota bacterium]